MDFYASDACQRFFCFRNCVQFHSYSQSPERVINNAKSKVSGIYESTRREFNNCCELNSYQYEKNEVLYYLDLVRRENFDYEYFNGVNAVTLKNGRGDLEVKVRCFGYNNIGDDNYNSLIEIFRNGRLLMTCVPPGAYSDGFVFWFLHEENYGLTLNWGKSRLYFRSANEQQKEDSGLFSFLKKWF